MPRRSAPKRTLKFQAEEENDEDSDLTDLESSEEEVVEPKDESVPPPASQTRAGPSRTKSEPTRGSGPATRARASKGPQQAAKPPDYALPPFNTSFQNIGTIRYLLQGGLINTSPEYQRDVVWTDRKQSNIIGAIFWNQPVPNLCFNRWFKDGKHHRTCIDGKQRLTSLMRFFDGEIPYRDPVRPSKTYYWKKQSPGQRRKLVDEGWRHEFEAKALTFYDYDGVTVEQERAMFTSVQLGQVLTPAEKLQSVNGGCADFVREIQRHVKSIPIFCELSEMGNNRGGDFLVLCQIVHTIYTDKDRSNKAPPSLKEAERLTTFLEGDLTPAKTKDQMRDDIKLAVDIFARLLMDKRHDDVWGTQNEITTTEFVLAIYVIWKKMRKLTDGELVDALNQIWVYTRKRSGGKKTKVARTKSCAEMKFMIDKLFSGTMKLQKKETTTVAADVKEEESSSTDDEDGMEVDDNDTAEPQRESAAPSRASKPEPTSKATSKKRSHATASLSDSDDDDVPLARQSQSRKKAKIKQPASRRRRTVVKSDTDEAVNPRDDDDDADSDDSGPTEIPKDPRRSATSTAQRSRPVSRVAQVAKRSGPTKLEKRSDNNAVASSSSLAPTSTTKPKVPNPRTPSRGVPKPPFIKNQTKANTPTPSSLAAHQSSVPPPPQTDPQFQVSVGKDYRVGGPGPGSVSTARPLWGVPPRPNASATPLDESGLRLQALRQRRAESSGASGSPTPPVQPQAQPRSILPTPPFESPPPAVVAAEVTVPVRSKQEDVGLANACAIGGGGVLPTPPTTGNVNGLSSGGSFNGQQMQQGQIVASTQTTQPQVQPRPTNVHPHPHPQVQASFSLGTARPPRPPLTTTNTAGPATRFATAAPGGAPQQPTTPLSATGPGLLNLASGRRYDGMSRIPKNKPPVPGEGGAVPGQAVEEPEAPSVARVRTEVQNLRISCPASSQVHGSDVPPLPSSNDRAHPSAGTARPGMPFGNLSHASWHSSS